jgi:hypothetical protein
MDHGVYGPDSFISCKGKRRGRGINACVSFLNQTVITDPRILRRDPVRSSGFIIMRIQTLDHGTPESSIPGFPMQLISRHVASINRTTQIYSGVSTMGNPELLSTGVPIPRFPMSQFTDMVPYVLALLAKLLAHVTTISQDRSLISCRVFRTFHCRNVLVLRIRDPPNPDMPI